MRAVSLSCATVCALALLADRQAAAEEWRDSTGTEQPLTAEELAERVLEANPGLAAIQSAAEAAAHRIEPAASLDDPVLSYGVAPLTVGTHGRLGQRVEVSQRFPWPGTLAARESAARHEAAAARREVESLRLHVVARAKSAWAEWRYVDSALQIHHATRALLDELLATARTQYAAGRALQQDVLQAEVERAQLEKHLLRLLRERATTRARINALLNREPDTPLPPAAAISLQASMPPLEALQTLAVRRHPELSRLEARISASESEVTVAEKAFYPNFELGAGYNSMWQAADHRPMISVSINVPFDRGKRRAEVDQALAEVQRAKYTLSERRAELLAALATAHAEVVEARNSVALYENELVPLAAQYLEAAIADYQSGAGAFLNIVTAEQHKLETELELARTRANHARRVAELELWTGGSLEFSLPAAAGVNQ